MVGGQRPPPARELERLDADAWGWLLVRIRAVLHEADDTQLSATLQRAADVRSSQLAGGRLRKQLSADVVGVPAIWESLSRRVRSETAVPAPVTALFEESDGPNGDTDRADDARVARLRHRLRETQSERDAALRQADGERSRAERLQAQAAELLEQLGEQQRRLNELEEALEHARSQTQAAVARALRRSQSQARQLEASLADARREVDELRRAARQRAAEQTAPVRQAATERDDKSHKVIPARPTILPDGVHGLSREAAELLMNRGRLVIIDGYNVSLTNYGNVELAAQRDWVVGLCTSAVQRYGVRAVVVFDSGSEAPLRLPGRKHAVEIRFSGPDITADDEIVFMVEATDEPVTVVTDDRELADRVRSSQADVIGTGPFVWACR